MSARFCISTFADAVVIDNREGGVTTGTVDLGTRDDARRFAQELIAALDALPKPADVAE